MGDRRGASLVLLAISLVVIMLMASLAIDLGRLLTERAEAQRAADAAALAGASAFLKGEDVAAQGAEAVLRSKELASRNTMGRASIDTSEVDECEAPAIPVGGEADPEPDLTRQTCELAIAVWYPTDTSFAKVRTRVRRAKVPIWFARVIGRRSWPVGAQAAAIAGPAGSAQCVLPIVFPDYWDETSTDSDGDNWPDDNEDWAYNEGPPRPDCYQSLADETNRCGGATGLGGDLRNSVTDPDGKKRYRDVGRPVVIKPRGGNAAYSPSFYNLWDMPGEDRGANDLGALILDCDPERTVYLNTAGYTTKPGATQGPVQKAFRERIKRWDPTGSQWAESDSSGFTVGRVQAVSGKDWRQSPRVILVPLAHPKFIGTGRTAIEFNTVAYFWLEAVGADIIARFVGPESGGFGGPTTGSPLLMNVRLVE